jgi:hypothetical protein
VPIAPSPRTPVRTISETLTPNSPGLSLSNGTRTLAQIYTQVECGRSRIVARTPVLSGSSSGGAVAWEDEPAWRFFRRVVRVGLWMRERAALFAGDRVTVVSPLCLERMVVEWATVAQGAVVAVVDPVYSEGELTTVFERLVPKVVFSAPSSLDRVKDARQRAAGKPGEPVVAFGEAGGGNAATSWAAVLDLGGTLDTAERAQSFRAAARAVRSEMAAVAHPDERGAWALVTHADVVHRLLDFWNRFPARAGDVAYVVDSGAPARTRLAPWAFVADGQTTVAIGTPGHEAQELASLQPDVVAAPTDVLARLGDVAWKDTPATGGHAPTATTALAWFARRLRHLEPPARPRTRRFFTLEGEARSVPATFPVR